jgi:hypothetical protein
MSDTDKPAKIFTRAARIAAKKVWAGCRIGATARVL